MSAVEQQTKTFFNEIIVKSKSTISDNKTLSIAALSSSTILFYTLYKYFQNKKEQRVDSNNSQKTSTSTVKQESHELELNEDITIDRIQEITNQILKEIDNQSFQNKTNIGILLINVGTPKEATPYGLWTYLTQFLMYKRIIDTSYWFRLLLVKGMIVPFRFLKSMKHYRAVWLGNKTEKDFKTSENAPLIHNSLKIKEALKEKLIKNNNINYFIELGNRYQYPSIREGLQKLHQVDKCQHILLVPLFPQYSSATVGSFHEECFEVMKDWQVIPNLHFISSFVFYKPWIQALSDKVLKVLEEDFIQLLETNNTIDKKELPILLFSYHGLPDSHVIRGVTERTDLSFCYLTDCHKTTHLVMNHLLSLLKKQFNNDNIDLDFKTSFQSRLGPHPWLKPYTFETIREFAKLKRKVIVVSASFIADCVETNFEIALEGKEEFEEAGGDYFRTVECVNDHPLFINGLVDIVKNYENSFVTNMQ
ncbi:hypothetical protein ABK040_009323 [Willaertia magna]